MSMICEIMCLSFIILVFYRIDPIQITKHDIICISE